MSAVPAPRRCRLPSDLRAGRQTPARPPQRRPTRARRGERRAGL